MQAHADLPYVFGLYTAWALGIVSIQSPLRNLSGLMSSARVGSLWHCTSDLDCNCRHTGGNQNIHSYKLLARGNGLNGIDCCKRMPDNEYKEKAKGFDGGGRHVFLISRVSRDRGSGCNLFSFRCQC